MDLIGRVLAGSHHLQHPRYVGHQCSAPLPLTAALGIGGSGRSFIQGQGVIVTWCVGHLVEALAPEGYDPALKQWRMESVPFFPETFRYAPIENTRDQYKVVAGLLNREDVTEVVRGPSTAMGQIVLARIL